MPDKTTVDFNHDINEIKFDLDFAKGFDNTKTKELKRAFKNFII